MKALRIIPLIIRQPYFSYDANGNMTSDGSPCYYVTDWQGNNAAVVGSDGIAVQNTTYYPYGEPTVEPKGQRYLFGGKEREHAGGRNSYDFGARNLTPYGTWSSPDPMATKFYNLNPYSYCAGDPINHIDPDGKKWKYAKEADLLEDIIQKEIDKLSATFNKKTNERRDCLDHGKDTKKIDNEIDDLKGRIENLNQSIADIKLLGKDSRIYSFYHVDGGRHCIYQGENGEILIQTSGYAFSVHEITHIRQALEKGNMSFDPNGFMYIPEQKLKDVLDFEVDAYKMQYSLQPSSLPVKAKSLKSINFEWIGKILDGNGELVYPFVEKYLKKK